MKKQLAILLAFMMIMSSMCGLVVSAEEPAADAPVIHMINGATIGGNNNIAAGQTLSDGKFALTLTVENTDGVGSNTIYIKYDKTKVRPVVAEMNAMNKFKAWKYEIATDKDKVFMSSEWSADIGVNILDNGMDTEAGYVYGVWKMDGGLSSEYWNGEGFAAEAGTFVFETLENVTTDSFDNTTFQVASISDVTEDVIYGQTSARTTLSAVANGSKLYGYSDSVTTRLPMTVKFTYPNSDKEVGGGDEPIIPDEPDEPGEDDPVVDADAPIIHMINGATIGGNNNIAAGQTLSDGKFALTLTVENTDGVGSNTIYIKYDKTKVRPVVAEMNAMNKFKAWKYEIATDKDKVFMSSEWSADIGVNILDNGMDTEAGYVYGVWKMDGGLSSEYWNGEGFAAEAGTFVFETLENVTTDSFDETTFQVASISDVTEEVIYGQTSARTTLSAVANGSKLYGYSDSVTTRLPMTVKFTYPNSNVVPGPGPEPEPTMYTVTFDNEGVVTEVEVEENTAIGDKMPADPVKDGYTFDGWFADGVEVTAETVVTGEIVAKAQFTFIPVEPTMYEVTFVVGDDVTKVEVEEGNSIANYIPVFEVPNGYEFDGWFVDGVEVKEDYVVTDNVVIKAQFTEKDKFTVTFIANGAPVGEITKYVGEVVAFTEFPEVPAAPEGFENGRWDVTTDITETTTVTAIYDEIVVPGPGEDDPVVDADAPIIHMINGATIGGNNNIAAGQTLSDGKFALTLTVENTDGVGSNTIYIKYDKTKVRPVVAEMNAMNKFKAWKYEIATDKDKVFMSSEWSADIGVNILDNGMDTEAGYVYGVWKMDGGLSSEYWNGEGFAAEAGTFVFETLENVTTDSFDETTFQVAQISDVTEEVIYGQTSARTTLSAVANGSKLYGYSDSVTTRLPMTVKFTYPNSDKEVGGGDEPVEPTMYTVTFDNEGVVTEVEVEENTAIGDKMPADPEKSGYTFDGWFNGEVEVTAETVVTEDIVAKARFTYVPVEPTMYTVTFIIGDNVTTKEVEEGSNVEFPVFEVPNGFTFDGWLVDGVEVPDDYLVTVTGDVVIEAKLTEIPTFTVTFIVRGEVIETITKYVGEKVSVDEFPEIPERVGYTSEWDVKDSISETTRVNVIDTPIFVPDVKLEDVKSEGLEIEFDENVTEYEAVVDADFDGNYYVIDAVAGEDVEVVYYIDGVKAEYTVNGALYFDMMAGTASEIKVEVTNAEGQKSYYTVDVTSLPATNNFFFTSGFGIDFDSTVSEYEATVDADEKYARLWAPAYAGMDIEYAVGGAEDVAEDATYAKLAVGCDERENTYFADTANFDTNWAEKSFVNLWTEDLASVNKMFIKITEGSEVSYYTINLN